MMTIEEGEHKEVDCTLPAIKINLYTTRDGEKIPHPLNQNKCMYE